MSGSPSGFLCNKATLSTTLVNVIMLIFWDPFFYRIKNKTMWADGNTKTEAFSEKLQRGAGVIFNPKIFVADSCQGFMSMKLIKKNVL